MNLFSKPTIAEVLQRELYGAELESINADKMADQWRAQADCAAKRVHNLRTRLAAARELPVPPKFQTGTGAPTWTA